MPNLKASQWITPAIILGATVGLVAWMYVTEFTLRAHIAVLLVLFAVFLLGIWWSFGTGRGKKGGLKAFAKFLLVSIAAFGAYKLTVRVEGVADGSGMPKVVWRWAKEKGADMAAPVEAMKGGMVADAESAFAAGFRDMTDFLGPLRNGVIPFDEFPLAEDWTAGAAKEIWRRAVGVGWSGFTVKGSIAVTQEERKGEEFVVGYNVLSGEPVWSHGRPAVKEVNNDGMGGPGPRATPVISGDFVYANRAGGILDCLNLLSGEVIWSKDVLEELNAGLPTWGKSNAPLVHNGMVVTSGGKGGDATLAAYDQITGKERWRSGSDNASYSSPVVGTLGGKEQIVSVNKSSVTGHDPASGAVLWRFPWTGSFPRVGQPVIVGDDKVLVTSSYGMGAYLLEVKSSAEHSWEVDYIWETIKALKTKFSSATVIGEYAYALDEGTFSCVSLADGKRIWKDGRYGFGQHIAVGNLMIVQSERGDVVLVEASPEKLIELGRVKALSSKTWNPPCLAGKYLLVRNDEEAVCYELPVK
ncbi:MAG: PQQ-binding-like beta-propeller repeat protein [Verrucomicrobiota bacterium]